MAERGHRAPTTVKTDRRGNPYRWDYTHGDIGVHDSRGEPFGSIDAMTGEPTKPSVPGRTLER